MVVLQKTGFGQQRIADLFMPDMHPNKAGHKVLADAMLPDIKKFIKKQKDYDYFANHFDPEYFPQFCVGDKILLANLHP